MEDALIPIGSHSSSASLSAPEPAEPPASGNNAALASSGEPGQAMPPLGLRSVSAPATATAAAIADEDVSKLDLAIMACTMTLLMPMAITIGGLDWKTLWKVLYGSLMIVSLVSTITGFLTAVVGRGGRTNRSSSRLSPSCARFGLVIAAALFVVFLSCRLARFGCLGGVAAAAVVVLILALAWVMSEPSTAEAAATEGVSV